MVVITTDPIFSAADAQAIFDTNNETELLLLINSLSDQLKSYTGRVQIQQALTLYTTDGGDPPIETFDEAITEVRRGPATPTLYPGAPVYVGDLTTRDVLVKSYKGGVLATTYSANDGDLVIYSDAAYSRIDLAYGQFPVAEGGDYLELVYYGGWLVVPGAVVAGATMQGRVELKRLRGEVGMTSHSGGRKSVSMEADGLIQTVADLWRPYRLVV